MKTFTNSLMILTIALLSFATVNAQTKLEKWAELKAFHGIMSKTFHPMEKGDFKPIREHSGEMYDNATKLASSKIPEEFNNKDVQQAVKDLETNSKKLNEMIKNKATDKEIETTLTVLHNTFHIIVERCAKPEDHTDGK